MNNFVYIIILNWNGWKDTIECLESVCKLNYSNFKIVVCDNASDDASIDQIKQWADGKRKVECQGNEIIQQLVFPLIKKPIPYVEYNQHEVEDEMIYSHPFTIIHLTSNLGFAGGNNIGIRYAIHFQDCKYVWLLNNDTVVDRQALSELVDCSNHYEQCITGSVLCNYYFPNKIQLGNSINRYFGTTRGIYSFDDINKLEFLVGASLFLPKSAIQLIGLLSEDYFLYYEEPDYWQRSKSIYKWICCKNSIVYHKEGSSIGANSKNKNCKSLIGDFHSIRNRRLYMKKYFPGSMLTVYVGLIFSMFMRIKRGQYNRVGMILKIIIHPLMTYREYLESQNSQY
jgi:GT2 family glycosyltransferase